MISTDRKTWHVLAQGKTLAPSASTSVPLRAADGNIVAVVNVSDVEEYTYGSVYPHLSESEALDRYRSILKVKDNDALVVLQDHDCGHWTVVEYKTPQAREGYFRQLLSKYLSILAGGLSVGK